VNLSWWRRFVGPALQLWGRRRVQAVLSTLGITVGVTGLILVVAIGEGANREMQSALGALGSGTLIVRAGTAPESAGALNLDRMESIRRLSGESLLHSVAVRHTQLDVTADQAGIEGARITGTSRAYRQFFRRSLHSGRFLADHDVLTGARVCVLGWEAGKTLFPRGQVIGQQVRIGNDWYKVVGWLGDSTSNMPQLESLDLSDMGQVVYVPYSAGLFGGRGAALDELMLRFDSEPSMMTGLRLVKRALGLTGDPPGVEYIIPIELIRHKQRMQQLFQVFLLGIAAIMLLVGGVGMMNIMLFNVITRRPEIGLRRAIGATRHDIIGQFVTESMVISLAGGAAGVVLGLLCAIVIDLATHWHTVFSLGAAGIGFVASLVIGGIFGSYPALQAASVSPVQSLRN